MRQLLCVRHQRSAPLGAAAGVLRAEGVRFSYFDAWRGDSLPELKALSGIVVLGGEMNVDAVDDHPWLKDVRDLVAEALRTDVPVLGICLGAQTMARALGAEVYPSPVREIGFLPVHHTDEGRADPVLAPFCDVPVFQWHEDAFALPRHTTLLCRGNDVAFQAFRAGERSYAVQFHFEVDFDVIAAWCDETDAELLRARWGTTRETLLEDARRYLPRQQAAARDALRAWLALL